MHWIKTKTLIDISKFGRKKKELDEASTDLILRIHNEQNLGARRLEAIIEFTQGRHIPHNAIHKVYPSSKITNKVWPFYRYLGHLTIE